MRACIQRVQFAEVQVNHQTVGKISKGRIFSDEHGKMNFDIQEIQGEILWISQFTLHASTKKSNRPSFTKAALAQQANQLYELSIEKMSTFLGKKIETGIFAADMQISLVNDGPVTILLDSKNKE